MYNTPCLQSLKYLSSCLCPSADTPTSTFLASDASVHSLIDSTLRQSLIPDTSVSSTSTATIMSTASESISNAFHYSTVAPTITHSSDYIYITSDHSYDYVFNYWCRHATRNYNSMGLQLPTGFQWLCLTLPTYPMPVSHAHSIPLELPRALPPDLCTLTASAANL